jgi:Late embryogenesis abundant protein
MRQRILLPSAAAAMLVAGCATLGLEQLIQPPRFTTLSNQQAELRVLGPSSSRPLGGAQVRLWARVENPNAFGVTLAALRGDLHLENARAAEVNFPLGLPLLAGRDTVIPLDVNLSFSDLPGLADALQRIITRNQVAYRLDGTLTLDAGALGQPTFGPTTWLAGESRVIR